MEDFNPEKFPKYDEGQLAVARRIYAGETVPDLVKDAEVNYSSSQLYRIRREVKEVYGETGGTTNPDDLPEEPARTRSTREGRTGQSTARRAERTPREIGDRWVWQKEDLTDDSGNTFESGAMYFYSGECTLHDILPNPHKATGRKPVHGLPRNERYDLYKEGMTVQEYINAGGERYDVEDDIIKQNVIVEGPTAAYYPVHDSERPVMARWFLGTHVPEDFAKLQEITDRVDQGLLYADFFPEAEAATDEDDPSDEDNSAVEEIEGMEEEQIEGLGGDDDEEDGEEVEDGAWE